MENIIKDSLIDHFNLKIIFQKTNMVFFHVILQLSLHMLECVNDLMRVIENGKCVDICCIDFKRAFDSVSINKLIHKLKYIGISEYYVLWLLRFLSNRQMSVKMNDTLSNSFLQISGVAQVPLLGHFASLFILIFCEY